MAELLSLVASIIQVAAFGLSISRTLHDYGSSVVGAEKRLKGLDKDIEFTSRIISQLGSRLQDHQIQALVSEDTIRLTQDAVAECDAIFQAMEDVIARIRNTGSMAKWTIYFRDSKIELLRSNLDRMKGNLNLLMGVIIHGTQMATERPDEVTVTVHRAKIRELMLEKEHYTQRYLEEKRKYDELLAKVNSTSTLGSIILISQADESSARNGGRLGGAGVPNGQQSDNGNQGVPIPAGAFFAMAPGALPVIKVGMDGTPEQATVFQQADMDMAGPQFAGQTHVSSPTTFSASRNVSHETGTQPAAAAPSSTPSPAPPQPHTPVKTEAATTTCVKPQKPWDRKKIVRRVGKGTAIVAAVIFFPVTVPFYIWRSKRKLGQGQNAPPSPLQHPNLFFGPTSHEHPAPAYQMYTQDYYPQQMSPAARYTSDWMGMQPQPYAPSPGPYASQDIPAELPGPHELAGAAELALVDRYIVKPDTRF